MESVFETLVEDKLEEESTLTSKCGILIFILTVLLSVVAEITTSVVSLGLGCGSYTIGQCVHTMTQRDVGEV